MPSTGEQAAGAPQRKDELAQLRHGVPRESAHAARAATTPASFSVATQVSLVATETLPIPSARFPPPLALSAWHAPRTLEVAPWSGGADKGVQGGKLPAFLLPQDIGDATMPLSRRRAAQHAPGDADPVCPSFFCNNRQGSGPSGPPALCHFCFCALLSCPFSVYAAFLCKFRVRHLNPSTDAFCSSPITTRSRGGARVDAIGGSPRFGEVAARLINPA